MDVEEELTEQQVAKWFKEFEEEDKAKAELIKERKVRPHFDYFNSPYLAKYALHCPKFKRLINSDDAYSIAILWEIYDFKRKLSRRGLESVNTFVTCKNCNGLWGRKACTIWGR